jgi:hypothetical protein
MGTRIWHRGGADKNSFLPLLDLLGISYEFSNDEDSIPIIDVGSLSPESTKFIDICDSVSNDYKKAIVLSTQEPWTLISINKLTEKYSNILFVDSSTPADNVVNHRYTSFPAFLCRSLSPRVHITLCFGDEIDYSSPKKLYSCLLARWKLEKHLLFSILSYHNLIKDGFVTYRSLFDVEDNELIQQHLINDDQVIEFKNSIEFILRQFDKDFITHAKTGIKHFAKHVLPNDLHIDEGQHWGQQSSVKWFYPIVRGQPRYIFEGSCFSLICETFSSFEDTGFRKAYISEKTMIPIMNGHPWLVFGDANFYSTMQYYGFEVHDELFNLDFDNQLDSAVRLKSIEQNLLGLTIDSVKPFTTNLLSETHKRIRHNRYNTFNTGSVLWNNLRKDMNNIFERFRDLNV